MCVQETQEGQKRSYQGGKAMKYYVQSPLSSELLWMQIDNSLEAQGRAQGQELNLI